MESDAFIHFRHSTHELLAGLRADRHKRRQALRRLSYLLPFRPFFRLMHQLIFRGGILDGPAGWTYCALYVAYEIMISAKIKEQNTLSESAVPHSEANHIRVAFIATHFPPSAGFGGVCESSFGLSSALAANGSTSMW